MNDVNVSELRVGIYVAINGVSLRLTKELLSLVLMGEVATPKAIPLTPELLERCGFEKYQWQDALFIKTKFGHLYILFFNGKIITKMVSVSSDSMGHKMTSLPFIGKAKCIENIIHLHQLQNLYLAITGGELPINIGFQPI